MKKALFIEVRAYEVDSPGSQPVADAIAVASVTVTAAELKRRMDHGPASLIRMVQARMDDAGFYLGGGLVTHWSKNETETGTGSNRGSGDSVRPEGRDGGEGVGGQ